MEAKAMGTAISVCGLQMQTPPPGWRLRREQPERPSQVRIICTLCRQEVWYDPKASIYPPTEIVICEPCLEDFVTDRNGPYNPQNWVPEP